MGDLRSEPDTVTLSEPGSEPGTDAGRVEGRLRTFWCAGFGVGYLRPAPGTWGSAAAVIIWWSALAQLSPMTQLGIIATYTAVSLLALRYVVRQSEIADPSWVVADEFAGQWLALLAAPQVWWVVLLGFGLFRLFDIAKPSIVGVLDRRVPGALGVMVDDLAAGVLAAGVLQLALLALGTAGVALDQ